MVVEVLRDVAVVAKMKMQVFDLSVGCGARHLKTWHLTPQAATSRDPCFSEHEQLQPSSVNSHIKQCSDSPIMSAGKEPADNNARPRIQRLPAPSLFVGPPSRNASNLSLQVAPKDSAGGSSRQPLTRQRSRLSQASEKNDSPASPIDSLTPGGFSRRPPIQTSKTEQMSNERTDALWAEMQNTLEEVELSASSGTHVFGPGHSRALEELRTAQIALAQAWAKSEAEDEPINTPVVKGRHSDRPINTADVLAADRAMKLGHGPKASIGGGGGGKTQLEEDTEKDIALARERREANDRYFSKVSKGVLEVVQKLEEVAKAMKNVEVESKEIWGDRDSVETGSVT